MGLWYTIFPKTDVQLGVKRVLTSQGIGLGVSTTTLWSVKLRPLRGGGWELETDGARLHSEARSSAVSDSKCRGQVHTRGRCALLIAS